MLVTARSFGFLPRQANWKLMPLTTLKFKAGSSIMACGININSKLSLLISECSSGQGPLLASQLSRYLFVILIPVSAINICHRALPTPSLTLIWSQVNKQHGDHLNTSGFLGNTNVDHVVATCLHIIRIRIVLFNTTKRSVKGQRKYMYLLLGQGRFQK